MTAHTAGQWLVVNDEPYELRVKVGDRTLAQLWQDDALPMQDDYNREQLANANLMAAAPELLAALRKAANDLADTYRALGGGAVAVSIGQFQRLAEIDATVAKVSGTSASQPQGYLCSHGKSPLSTCIQCERTIRHTQRNANVRFARYPVWEKFK